MNVIDLVKGCGIELRRAGNKHGGEFHGPCPGCGGDDRFHVWPGQNDGSGSYWCRQCGKAGDNIQFLRDFKGYSFEQASQAVGREIDKRNRHLNTPSPPTTRHPGKFTPDETTRPADLWQEKASKFVQWCFENLIKNNHQRRYLSGRGITAKTIKQYRLGYNPEDLWRPRESWGLETELKNGRKKRLWLPKGIIIPYLDGNGKVLRVRIRRGAAAKFKMPYYLLPGSSTDVMVFDAENRVQVVVESELCGYLINQNCRDLAGAAALGNASRKPDKYAYRVLKNAALVLLVVDFDDAGKNAVSWWLENFENAKLWPVPAGKDPTDAKQAGVDLRKWIEAAYPPAWRTKKETEKPPPGVPEKVMELAALLKKYPVKIRSTPERTSVVSDAKWELKNWELSKRIAHLVFFTPEVLAYLDSHPSNLIDGKNILSI